MADVWPMLVRSILRLGRSKAGILTDRSDRSIQVLKIAWGVTYFLLREILNDFSLLPPSVPFFSARFLGSPMLRLICKAKNPKFQSGSTLFQGCATATEWTATATLDWATFWCWVENKTFPTVQSKGDPVPVKVVSLAYIVICYLLLDVMYLDKFLCCSFCFLAQKVKPFLCWYGWYR